MAAQRVFFLHIPKTAGTSLRAVFERSVRSSEFLRISKDDEAAAYKAETREALCQRLLGYKLVTGHLRLNFITTVRDQFRWVTVLRHPVDRVLSIHGFYREQDLEGAENRADGIKLALARRLDPVAFAESEHPILRDEVNNGMCRMLIDAHPRELDTLDDVELFSRARDSLETMVFGLVNVMDQSLELFAHAGLIFPTERTPKVNVTGKRKGFGELKPGEFDRILRRNLADMLLFDWAAAEFARRYARMQRGTFLLHHQQSPLPTFQPVPNQAGTWNWGVEQAVCGENWHEVERLGNGLAYRFTGPGNRATLWFDCPVKTGPVKLTAVVVISSEPEILEYARLEVNGHFLPHFTRWVPDEGVRLSATVPADYLDPNGLLSVTLITPYTTLPLRDKPGAKDPRELGVGLSSIRLEPAGP